MKRRAELTARDIHKLVGTAPLFLEIGCNDGTDTLKFLREMPSATIYCFEPESRAIDRFLRTVQDDRVTLHRVAVGDFDGSALFYGSAGQPPPEQRTNHYCHLPEWDLSGSLYRPTGHLTWSKWCTFPEEQAHLVQVQRLDTWVEARRHIACIDFVWTDVQGAEDAVIRGAYFALSMTRYFYTEFSDTPLYENQVPLATIKDMLPGFECLGIYGENALFKNLRLP